MVLVRLAASTVERTGLQLESSGDLARCLQGLDNWHLPRPSTEPLVVDDQTIPLVWREHRVVAVPEGFPAELVAKLESMAFSVCTLPKELPSDPPPQLTELLGDLV
jgi:hypothetical protein